MIKGHLLPVKHCGKHPMPLLHLTLVTSLWHWYGCCLCYIPRWLWHPEWITCPRSCLESDTAVTETPGYQIHWTSLQFSIVSTKLIIIIFFWYVLASLAKFYLKRKPQSPPNKITENHVLALAKHPQSFSLSFYTHLGKQTGKVCSLEFYNENFGECWGKDIFSSWSCCLFPRAGQKGKYHYAWLREQIKVLGLVSWWSQY